MVQILVKKNSFIYKSAPANEIVHEMHYKQ